MHLCHLGWGGGNNVHGNLNIRPATLWDLLLHLRTYVMLRCGIFSCTCAHTSCYAVGSSLELAHIRPATLWNFLLHLPTYVMLRFGIFRPGLFLAPALCLVFSNFDLNLLISRAALELQLSKRCPTWPHPRHVRGIRS